MEDLNCNDGEFLDDYDVGETLGTGAFAVVKEATQKSTGKKFAVKIVKRGDVSGSMLDDLKAEVQLMQMLDHPNVIAMTDLYITPQNFYICMELVTGGELFDRIVNREDGKYTEKDACLLVRELLKSMQYLQSHDIVHRDLKPENLLYADERDESDIKIGDFGLARVCPLGEQLTQACGTPGYVAPEVLKMSGYSVPADMWSIGVIVYILLSGTPPFYEEDQAKLFKSIIKARYSFPKCIWKHITPEAIDLVKRLLEKDPAKRLTATQALDHPWIVNGAPEDGPNLNETIVEMKKFNAKRKLKGAMKAVLATQKVSLLIKAAKLAASDSQDSLDSDEGKEEL